MRLIDADALWLDIANRSACLHDCCPRTKGKKGVLSLIDEAPIIEAEPVRRGYWKVHITSCRMYLECSECKKLFSNPLWMFDNDNKKLLDFMEEDNAYCRGCGAKMDLDIIMDHESYCSYGKRGEFDND